TPGALQGQSGPRCHLTSSTYSMQGPELHGEKLGSFSFQNLRAEGGLAAGGCLPLKAQRPPGSPLWPVSHMEPSSMGHHCSCPLSLHFSSLFLTPQDWGWEGLGEMSFFSLFPAGQSSASSSTSSLGWLSHRSGPGRALSISSVRTSSRLQEGPARDLGCSSSATWWPQ
ncbi:hypothetical protein H1C71_004955, partial [Ictidomys tridecemlineatus]